MHFLEDGIGMKEKLKNGKDKNFSKIKHINNKRNENTEKYNIKRYFSIINPMPKINPHFHLYKY